METGPLIHNRRNMTDARPNVKRIAGYVLVAVVLFVVLWFAAWSYSRPATPTSSSSKVFFDRESGTAGGMRCDGNGDGVINAADIAILKLFWKGFPDPHLDCDVDGKIDARNLAIELHEWIGAPAAPGTESLPLPVGVPGYRARPAYHLAVPAPPTSAGWNVGERVFVSILLSTGQEALGAGEVSLVYPPSQLAVRSVRSRSSIWNVWTQRPFPPYQGVLTFAGGRTGGFVGTDGTVAVVEFEVLTASQAFLGFQTGATVFKFDNVGTTLPPPALGTADLFRPVFTVANASPTGTPALIQVDNQALMRRFSVKDTEPPEPFDTLITFANAPGGPRWFVEMHAEDALGGPITYEIHEGLYRTVQTVDTYALRSQSPGTHPLRIIARDDSGNGRRLTVFVTIPGQASGSVLASVPQEGWFALLLIPLFLGGWWIWRRRMQKRRDTMRPGGFLPA